MFKFLAFFLCQVKLNKDTNKKNQVLVSGCHQNSVPPWDEIQMNQLTPNLPDFRGKYKSTNPSKLIRQWKWILSKIYKWLTHPHLVLPVSLQVVYVL